MNSMTNERASEEKKNNTSYKKRLFSLCESLERTTSRQQIKATSMDPFEYLFPEILESTFDYLSVKEIKSALLVSKLWHDILIEMKCMNRLKVFIYQQSQEDLDFAVFATTIASRRKYKNISINLNNFSFVNLQTCSPLNYKNVRYSDGVILKSLWPLKCIENSVVILSLSAMTCDVKIAENSLKFPNLKKLTLYKNSDTMDACFKNCRALKNLCYVQKSGCLNDDLITALLLNNSLLDTLELNIKNGLSATPKFKFNLRSFKLNSIEEMTNNLKEMLLAMIKSQKDSLEILEISQWCGVEILREIFTAKNLNDLTININHGLEDVSNIFLHSNASISRLDILEIPADTDLVQQIIKLPNLRVFKTCRITYGDMIALDRQCKHLRELHVEEFLVDFIPNQNLFSNLKVFQQLSVSDNLMIFLQSKRAEKLSNFEDLILRSVIKQ